MKLIGNICIVFFKGKFHRSRDIRKDQKIDKNILIKCSFSTFFDNVNNRNFIEIRYIGDTFVSSIDFFASNNIASHRTLYNEREFRMCSSKVSRSHATGSSAELLDRSVSQSRPEFIQSLIQISKHKRYKVSHRT